MQGMREVIRGSLARSLRLMSEEDRLASALPVVCGSALAGHCEVARLDEDRTLHVRVDSPEWLTSAVGMKSVLQHDLQRVAGVSLSGLHFVEAGSAPGRAGREFAEPWAPERRNWAQRSTFTRKGRAE
jgi:hypothetical protein